MGNQLETFLAFLKLDFMMGTHKKTHINPYYIIFRLQGHPEFLKPSNFKEGGGRKSVKNSPQSKITLEVQGLKITNSKLHLQKDAQICGRKACPLVDTFGHSVPRPPQETF